MSLKDQERKSSFRDKIRNDQQRQKDRFKSFGYLNLPDKVEVFKPEIDTTVEMDIFPYLVTDEKHPDDIKVGETWYKRSFYIHRNIGIPSSSYVCPQSIGKKCPICEERARLIKEGRGKEETDDLKPSQRNLYNVRLITFSSSDYKKYKKNVNYIMDISWSAFQDRLDKSISKKDDFLDFPDPEYGYTLEVDFEAKAFGKSKPYANAGSISLHKREEQYDSSIIEESINLDSVLKVLSYNELKEIFFELNVDDPDDQNTIDTSDVSEKEEEYTSSRRKKTENIKKEDEENKEEDQSQKKEFPISDLPESWPDLLALSQSKLLRICRTAKLNIDPSDFDDDTNALRSAIANEIGIEIPTIKQDKKITRANKESKEALVDPKNKCPHGLQFGVDIDSKDVCDQCNIWDDCADEKDKNIRSNKKK